MKRPLLIGDGIENPHNVRALGDAAALFDWSCGFRDRAGLAEAWEDAAPRWLEDEDLASRRPLLALENAPGASSLYGFRAGNLSLAGLIVGNERRGIDRGLLKRVDRCLALPMASRRVNTLNVAAAAAVSLYYLSRGGGGPIFRRPKPEKARPVLLLLGGRDHVELGSAIRSAAALGWSQAYVEDPAGVWFGCDRVTRSEGRGAARRGKNAIRLVPADGERRYPFDEACVVSTARGEPLGRSSLAGGPGQALVIMDEESREPSEDLSRLARRLRYIRIEAPGTPARSRFRLTASIALAEAARQVGIRTPKGRRGFRPPRYDRALTIAGDEGGEWVSLAQLAEY